MKERPILFSAPMVRALLAGTKSQTRRVVGGQWKVEPEEGRCAPFRVHAKKCDVAGCEFKHTDDPRDDDVLQCGGHELRFDGVAARSPYGKPGGRLWVRETWAPHDEQTIRYKERDHVYYRADDLRRYDTDGRWRPSIFMPRWASRLTLEVTSVRVERLQDISEADAKAEGLEHYDDDGVTYWGPLNDGHFDPRHAYRQLWESINGPDSWAANPWVWVVEFRAVKGATP